jgi:DNA polymerase-3 subunit gamma/tau
MSWYRIYRPQTVAGLHIKTVRDSLLSMLQSGNIPHALLFAGSKGTGKTSSARIIAKVLNCEKNAERKQGEPFQEPCNECTLCKEITAGSSLNVVEMDGASNRRIDDIRNLKERLYIPPAQGKKSVYIIDEVHMLTKEAFNALLKMLEEPPEHVVFIFATTDAHKIPDTITSRCTRVQFAQASVAELTDALVNIGKQEKVTAEPAALELISQTADGSFRDAVKMFEQIANQAKADKKEVSLELVSQSLFVISQSGIKALFDSILQKDEKKVIAFFQDLRSRQIDAFVVHKQILQFLHVELMKSFDPSKGTPFSSQQVLLFLLKQFSVTEIPLQHPFPLLPLELCALEMVLRSKEKNQVPKPPSSGGGGVRPAVSPQPTVAPVPSRLIAQVQPISVQAPTINVVATVEALPEVNTAAADGALLGTKWQDLLKTVGKRNLSLEAILRSAQFVQGEHGKAMIKVFYGFHKDQLELQRYRTIIDEAIHELVGGHVRFEYVLSDQASKQLTNENSNVTGKIDEELVNVIEEALM